MANAPDPTAALTPDLFERMVRGAPDAVVIADADGIIRLWNAAAAAMFGVAEADAVGRSMDFIIPEPQRERHWEGFYRVVRDGAPSRYGPGDMLRVPAVRADGARLSVEFTLQIVEAAGRRLAVATFRDVTEQWQTMRDLRARLRELEGEASP